MARLLYGVAVGEKMRAEDRAGSEALRARGAHPKLAIVGVGGDPAAHSYVQRLERSAKDSGIEAIDAVLPRDATEKQLIAHLEQLSADPTVKGILLLTPLPGALDEAHVIDHIAIAKDVEGMHPFNMGFLADGRPRFVPSTADAVVELLKFYEVPLEGAHAVIIGRSTVIGRPAAYLLLAEDATVSIAHRRTKALEKLTQAADIVVVGIGRAGFLTGSMIKPGATGIDAGINMTPHGLAGVVELQSVAAGAGALAHATPRRGAVHDPPPPASSALRGAAP